MGRYKGTAEGQMRKEREVEREMVEKKTSTIHF